MGPKKITELLQKLKESKEIHQINTNHTYTT